VNNNESFTLRQYYLSFKSISGAIAGLFSAFPLLSRLFLPESYRAYCFPPLGSVEGPARIATVALGLATTYFAFFARATLPSRNRRRVATGLVLAFICLCLYIGLFLRFVRNIDIPSRNTSVQVSVGYERSDFAKTNFAGDSDWELLRERGTSEEDIWRLWTTKSLLISRLSLYISYSLFIFSLVAAFSWGIVDQLSQSQESGREKVTVA
jgi:hypothetical protein